MADQPVFKRTFEHSDWTDNVDRVQADGPNGFNIRFHSLEAEFDNLYNISAQVRDALAALGGIVRRSVTLTFTPNFTGQPPTWTLIDGAAISPAGNTNLLEGWLPLQLPDGMQAQSMTIFGQKKGSFLAFQLQLVQQSVADSTQQQTMSVVKLDKLPDGPFQSPGTIPGTLQLIDNSKFKYLLFATLAPANSPADPTATARINAIQVVCVLP